MPYALVSGASSGIGYNLALILAQRGFKVYGGAPEHTLHLMEPLRQHGVVPFALDIRKPESVQKAVEFFREHSGSDSLDILYNNAGIADGGPGFDFEDEAMMNIFAVNVTGHMLMTKYFTPFVIQAKGAIVYTASVAGIVPLCWTSLYCSTKAAINAYAKGIRVELEPFGVRVYSVITGGVDTDIAKEKKGDISKRIGELPYQIQGLEESIRASANMTCHGTKPNKYARSVLNKVLAKHRGFNIYEGYRARLLKFISNWFPLWLQYRVIGSFFKQNKPLAELRKRYR
ncbi:hypothetical protein FT663_00237 [Candidozyma haemuli var. vulneris]|uniref:NADPH-dependent 1-acyldihydroxyacetone phosphate reductase n=1 Tax=Candidozyma haemuli TaxID=45357 RepID=A0A2V1APU4_9ASCO|nr:hypothetical protein CXQ85_003579 [[Candida] haemuloni]KAF3993567.1 hypothetical protein FT662_00487 [[Candida] haemuloni var. vulneris]KAF3995641.1 hypothetical protein FT663_00237 [[Candida] haemuloni var. vulneris]PVH19724.1 hypothetical protein CXQ85_003579 [[Candida] haemuloni]